MSTKKLYLWNACFVLSSMVALPVVAQQQTTLLGFSPQSSKAQLELEKKFDAQLSAAAIGQNIKALSAFPHHMGSPGGKAVAQNILRQFQAAGFDAKIETYQVLFPTPTTRVLEMTSPKVYKALLKEPALTQDATSGQAGQLPTYNAWSADGDVTAPLVFVNYGLPEDYLVLEQMGVTVKGKIVIAKYGRSWRGIKPKVAQEHGALGCLIYSDPQDDGYTAGEVYPKGAFKNEYGVQRGSIMDMVIYPGDPVTPNVGATPSAQRLNRLEAPNLLKIPVLPISYKDAQPLLAALEGKPAPKQWAGSLPITYHVGGTEKTKVHLKTAFDWKITTIENVIATIKGAEFPDQWVVRGNHHDAWVNGANDPISGMAAELEEAKAIGALLKTGWRPKRTLVYCAWDAEEPGLMGSTEWVEDHAQELQEKCVAYINSDSNGKGFLDVEGSHALQGLVTEISQSVMDPQKSISVFSRARARRAWEAKSPAEKTKALSDSLFAVGAMGSGSDYSSFIQHLGIPALNIAFDGENDGGEYHSIYDSYDHYKQFKDPGFVYGVALAQTAGRTALRLAEAEALPFQFSYLHQTVLGYVKELKSWLETEKEKMDVQTLFAQQKIVEAAADPAYHQPRPPAEPMPTIDFSLLDKALDQLAKACKSFEQGMSQSLTPAQKNNRNTQLYRAEQSLLSSTGLPRRSWYKHVLYAPGFYTGYGVKTLPGIREALEQHNWKEAQEQVVVVAAQVETLANRLNK
ncbi:MAG: M28 family peptidase [Sphingobacteriia bacterium]|nr:MAG: M28 family peptidase [Sphingobacteriia bacterium]